MDSREQMVSEGLDPLQTLNTSCHAHSINEKRHALISATDGARPASSFERRFYSQYVRLGTGVSEGQRVQKEAVQGMCRDMCDAEGRIQLTMLIVTVVGPCSVFDRRRCSNTMVCTQQ
jgi:hypothetical protein